MTRVIKMYIPVRYTSPNLTSFVRETDKTCGVGGGDVNLKDVTNAIVSNIFFPDNFINQI